MFVYPPKKSGTRAKYLSGYKVTYILGYKGKTKLEKDDNLIIIRTCFKPRLSFTSIS